MVMGAHECSQGDVDVGTSPRPCSQAPCAMVFVEQHISLVRIWLCLCECHAEAPWWQTPTEECCFLASAGRCLWVWPHLHSILGLSSSPLGLQLAQPCRHKSSMCQCCLGVPWLEALGVRGCVLC